MSHSRSMSGMPHLIPLFFLPCLLACLYAFFIQQHIVRLLGHRAVFIGGLFIFAITMTATIAAPTVPFLNVVTALSGVGFAALTSTPNMLVTLYNSDRQVSLQFFNFRIGFRLYENGLLALFIYKGPFIFLSFCSVMSLLFYCLYFILIPHYFLSCTLNHFYKCFFILIPFYCSSLFSFLLLFIFYYYSFLYCVYSILLQHKAVQVNV